ncbi:BrnT family toxin [soil metagenome]
MRYEWDEEKRASNLARHKLDFKKAEVVFQGRTITFEDDRQDYGEDRYATLGRLGKAVVFIVWTDRKTARRIISMRKCDVEEREIYHAELDRYG